MISLIVCVNKKEIYERLLLPSIKKQKYKDYEIIVVDTNNKPFSSGANALNYGASLAKGDVLLFCHQDIEFIDNDSFNTISNYCNSNNFGIAGVAGIVKTGMKKKDYTIYSSVLNGPEKIQVGVKNTTVMNVDTLDECFFIIKKNNFSNFINYDSWHLYAVEYCLRSKKNNQSVVLLPVNIFHESPGWSLDKSYWNTLLKVAKDYEETKVIPTTMGVYINNALLRLRIIRNRIKRRLNKK